MVTQARVVSIRSGGAIGRSYVLKTLSMMMVPDSILNYSQASTRMDLFGADLNLVVKNIWCHFTFAILYKEFRLLLSLFSFEFSFPDSNSFTKTVFTWWHLRISLLYHQSFSVAIEEEDLFWRFVVPQMVDKWFMSMIHLSWLM